MQPGQTSPSSVSGSAYQPSGTGLITGRSGIALVLAAVLEADGRDRGDVAAARRWSQSTFGSGEIDARLMPATSKGLLRLSHDETPAVAGVPWSSGGGIRTRDLRVMRTPRAGQQGRLGL